MKKNRFRWPVLLISFGLFMLYGCGKKSDNYDGYLNTFSEGQVSTIDSLMYSDLGSDSVISNVQSTLFRRKESGEILPELAKDYEISEDGITYTFHLRDTAWSNGEPLTAHDFEFGMKLYLTIGGGFPGAYIEMANIKNAGNIYYGDENGVHMNIDELGVRAIDDKTLEITVERPIEYLPSILSMSVFAPINEKFYKSQEPGMYATGPDTILCSGPYMIEDYIPGTSTILVKKNPYYYDAENIKIPGIRFVAISNADTSISAFKIGEMESVLVPRDSHKDVADDPQIGQFLHDFNMGAFTYLIFNMKDGYGTAQSMNRNLRLAITNAIDRESICENVLNGTAEACYAPVPQNTFFNSETGEDFIKDPESFKKYCDFNTERAREYFEKAKEELGQDSISISVLTAPNNIKIMQVIKEQLEKNLPGFTLNIEPVQFTELIAHKLNFDFEVMISGYVPDFMDPMALYILYADNSEINDMGYHNDEFMKVYQECTVGECSMDHAKRWKAMQESLDLVAKDQPLVPICLGVRSVLIDDRLKGVDYLQAGSVIYRDAWIE